MLRYIRAQSAACAPLLSRHAAAERYMLAMPISFDFSHFMILILLALMLDALDFRCRYDFRRYDYFLLFDF